MLSQKEILKEKVRVRLAELDAIAENVAYFRKIGDEANAKVEEVELEKIRAKTYATLGEIRELYGE